MEREQLDSKVTDYKQKQLLAIIDDVCKGAFISNRQRLELVQELDKALLVSEEKVVAKIDELEKRVSDLVVSIDTSYCEACAERDGIFDHLK